MQQILVIKLGALGDFVLAFSPFAAVRAAFPEARLTLLTTAPFHALAERSPWFDTVLDDDRPRWTDLPALNRLRHKLQGFDRIIDLQTSGRSSRYHWLAGRPCWSGIATGCTRPHDNPQRDDMHTVARQRDQLRRAGVPPLHGPVALDWLATGGPSIPAPYAVLVPGAAPHRPAKRWPAEHFGALGQWLTTRQIQPVIIGTKADAHAAAAVQAACPTAIDLTDQTSLPDLGGLLHRAALAIGNDTGPMHLAAAMGCPTLTLFSAESDPGLTAPVGRRPGQARVLRVPTLETLDLPRVTALAATMLAQPT